MTVYWSNCFVSVIPIDSEGKRGSPVHIKQRNGQGKVPKNTALYFAGDGGKVKVKED